LDDLKQKIFSGRFSYLIVVLPEKRKNTGA